MSVRIVAVFELYGASPRKLRERFAQALREAVQRAWADGRIDLAQAEELIRALPERGRA